MRGSIRFDCSMPGCSNRLDVPDRLLADEDRSGDFEHGIMDESIEVLESVGWMFAQWGGPLFICPAHGTREQVTRAMDWGNR